MPHNDIDSDSWTDTDWANGIMGMSMIMVDWSWTSLTAQTQQFYQYHSSVITIHDTNTSNN